MNFHKKLHILKYDSINFSKCNNFIRCSNYTRDGFGLKAVVARYLGREIMKRINDLSHRSEKLENLDITDILQGNQDDSKKLLGTHETTCSFLGKELPTTISPEDSTRQKICNNEKM